MTNNPTKAEPVVTQAAGCDTYAKPVHGWTCFHCGETFTTSGSARDHFGFGPESDPGCRIKLGGERGLLMALRKAEDEIDRLVFELHNEGADACKAHRAQATRHHSQIEAAEESGYERGLADARLAAQAQPEGLLARLDQHATHSVGCAIYQKSWATGAPDCSCGLDAVRADMAALSTVPQQGVAERFDGEGWVYFSPDAGTEYARQHPVESGETPDATDIRRSTAMEDALHDRVQEQAALAGIGAGQEGEGL